MTSFRVRRVATHAHNYKLPDERREADSAVPVTVAVADRARRASNAGTQEDGEAAAWRCGARRPGALPTTTRTIAVLFARRNSVYKTLPDCDVFDMDRDAWTFVGGTPVVAHPPCRAWGALRQFAKPREGERELAIWAVEQVRREGGVLEHPRASRLWPELGLPLTGIDEFGGWTLDADQCWWGHAARKRSLFYICGLSPRELPTLPFSLSLPSMVVKSSRPENSRGRTLPHSLREATPPALAEWLLELARRCRAIEQRRLPS